MSSILNLIRAKRASCRQHMDGLVALLLQENLSDSAKALTYDVINKVEKILYDAYVAAENDAIKNMTDKWAKEIKAK
jgi:hypothetical protein